MMSKFVKVIVRPVKCGVVTSVCLVIVRILFCLVFPGNLVGQYVREFASRKSPLLNVPDVMRLWHVSPHKPIVLLAPITIGAMISAIIVTALSSMKITHKFVKDIVRPVKCGTVQNALLVIVAILYSILFMDRIVPVSVKVSDFHIQSIRHASDAIKQAIKSLMIKNRVWRAGTGHGRTGHAVSVPEPLVPMEQHVNNKKSGRRIVGSHFSHFLIFLYI